VSWGKIATGVGAVVLAVISFVAGKVWGNAEGEKSREKMNAENEDLRREIRAVLEIFKAEMARKNEEIKWLDGVIDKLTKSPPADGKQLRQRLQKLALTDSQIESIEVRMGPIYRS
jgi:uncharacterized protein YlxW (UPF0749 family)